MTFANRLKKIIEMKYDGVAYRYALAAGLRASTLHNYIERGSLPGVEIVIKLAHAGDVSIDWLLTGESQADAAKSVNAVEYKTNEEREYLEMLLRVLRNSKTRDAIKKNLDTFMLVPLDGEAENTKRPTRRRAANDK